MGCGASKKKADVAPAEAASPKKAGDTANAAGPEAEGGAAVGEPSEDEWRLALEYVMGSGSDLSIEINQTMADEKLLNQVQKDAICAEYRQSS